jgi:hypothetical protein
VSLPELPDVLPPADLAATVSWIGEAQTAAGAIPWWPDGPLDPWDHVEAAMALDAGGHPARARAAYRWLSQQQRDDGSWPSRYEAGSLDGAPVPDAAGESHHGAYVAVGCWHHWLTTGDDRFLRAVWPMVRRALDHVLDAQAPGGEVWWARRPGGGPDRLALLTACCSIHQALRCGLALAARLGQAQPEWELAAGRLRHALRHHGAAFADRDRYAMDWYYPILGGVVRGPAAHQRLAARWPDFVVRGHGVRCVSDRPWVTAAETAELALALAALDRGEPAAELIRAAHGLRHDDGSYWTGLVLEDGQRWPVERTTWTAAAVVLATAALRPGSPTAQVFTGTDLPFGVEMDGICDADLACTATAT